MKQKRVKKNITNIVLIRVEQLYPFPLNQIGKIIEKYNCKNIFWVQEEPQNMGYWKFIHSELSKYNLKLISRKRSSSPSTGFFKAHTVEQNNLIDKVFK